MDQVQEERMRRIVEFFKIDAQRRNAEEKMKIAREKLRIAEANWQALEAKYSEQAKQTGHMKSKGFSST